MDALNNLAATFDLPIDAPEHVALANDAWLGGSGITVRYFLGRETGLNLFRKDDVEVQQHLVDYFCRNYSKAVSELLSDDRQAWEIAGELLQYHFQNKQKRLKKVARRIEQIEAFLVDPTLTLSQLALQLKTTEKQLARNSTLTVARKLACSKAKL